MQTKEEQQTVLSSYPAGRWSAAQKDVKNGENRKATRQTQETAQASEAMWMAIQ